MRGRAFVDGAALQPGTTTTLDPQESHYLVRVRRAGAGDAIELLDGAARRHAGTVVRADARACTVEIGDAIPAPVVAPIVVLMGIVDARAVAEAIAGASEAGARELVPVHTARAQPAMPTLERIDKLVRAAQRQCGRESPLHVSAAHSLAAALELHATLPGFVACLHGPAGAPRSELGARVLIGPEGGLRDEERALAVASGLQPLGLGPYVLRTPTAVVAAVARLLGR